MKTVFLLWVACVVELAIFVTCVFVAGLVIYAVVQTVCNWWLCALHMLGC